ncbi:helix-turn-helix transcriptional regulator [Neisseriaceae bacterium ESL0693]|nr:helix-turn-helix transcriptional regulator [Neisseriaceae bacterium ESL0693]
MSLLHLWQDFNPDINNNAVTALHIQSANHTEELPPHHHHKNQLILTLKGGVTCLSPNAYWLVPTGCAAWIPSGMVHSNRTTANAEVLFLYIDAEYTALPRYCCTLNISPLVREMIKHFATLPHDYQPGSHTDQFARVMLHELASMPIELLNLPISPHPKIRQLADALINNPADRQLPDVWAQKLALSKRSLERLIKKETGMSFGRWRQQLRLLTAIRQLCHGESVQNIAFELGYESVTAFITMFKKQLGQTPKQYAANLSATLR